MDKKDSYKTITKPSTEVLFKDKNSKFFGYAFPVKNEEEVKGHIEKLKKTTSFCQTLVLCIPNRHL